MIKKILMASDHAGVLLKSFLIQQLNSQYKIVDFGPSNDNRVDYPDYAALVAQELQKNLNLNCVGILICGSGIGMSITANKFKGIRAAVVESVLTAELARAHNNANILCLGARIINEELALKMTKAFLNTNFEGGRHENRIKKINHWEQS